MLFGLSGAAGSARRFAVPVSIAYNEKHMRGVSSGTARPRGKRCGTVRAADRKVGFMSDSRPADNAVRHDTSIEADSLAGSGSKTRRLLSQWKTPANITTMVRIVLVIATIVLTCLAGPWGHDNYRLRWIAAVLFIVAASTDKLDGYLARSRNEVTDLGKILDPIADKLLTCSMLVVLSIFAEIPWWVTILFLIREVGITIWRMVSLDKQNLVIPANWPGKLKTVFECVATAMLLVPLWQFDPAATYRDGWWGVIVFNSGSWSYWYALVSYVFLGIALGLCLYSGGNYLYQAHVQLSARRKAKAQEQQAAGQKPDAGAADAAADAQASSPATPDTAQGPAASQDTDAAAADTDPSAATER
jgi:CDP-diacylglycerol--glycerol-3-phosphate 3-phosphatidyltransferase